MNGIPKVRIVFDRRKQSSKEKAAPIQIEVMYLGERKWYGTGIKIKKHQWDSKRLMVNNNNYSYNEYNKLLYTIFKQYADIISSILESGMEFSFDLLKDLLEKGKNSSNFVLYLEEQLKKWRLATSTRKSYMTALRKIEEFGEVKSFNDINIDLIKRFDNFLRINYPKLEQSSIASYHKLLNRGINCAILDGYLSSNPYRLFKVEKGKRRLVKYLVLEEIQIIKEYIPSNKTMEEIKDLFIFQIYTGLSYSDMYKLSFESVELNKNGDIIIKDTRQKTLEIYYLQILSPARAVLEKYKYKLPIYTPIQYNKGLKMLALNSKLGRNLTSHMGRHTFATTIALANKVPIEIVSKMLGHTNINTTQRYAQVLAEDVFKEYDRLSKLI